MIKSAVGYANYTYINWAYENALAASNSRRFGLPL